MDVPPWIWKNEWKLRNSMAVFKKPTSKSWETHHQKNHHHQNTFFVRSGGTGSFHNFFCLASKSWDFPTDADLRQWGKTRARNPQPHNQGISELVQSDPPTCKSNKANSTSGAGGRGWWNFTPSKNLQWLLLWWSSLTISSRNAFLIFPSNWVFNDFCP